MFWLGAFGVVVVYELGKSVGQTYQAPVVILPVAGFLHFSPTRLQSEGKRKAIRELIRKVFGYSLPFLSTLNWELAWVKASV